MDDDSQLEERQHIRWRSLICVRSSMRSLPIPWTTLAPPWPGSDRIIDTLAEDRNL